MWRMFAILTVAGLLSAGRVGAGDPVALDDDLTVVRKAVSVETQSPEKPAPLVRSKPTAKAKDPAPQWLKVRVIEKGRNKARVTINLPLDLVRSLPELPVDWHCDKQSSDRHCPTNLTDLLARLESGTEIVDIEDDDSTVRVWLE